MTAQPAKNCSVPTSTTNCRRRAGPQSNSGWPRAPSYRQLSKSCAACEPTCARCRATSSTEDLGPAILRRAERSVLGGGERPVPRRNSLPGSSVSRWWAQRRSARMLVWPAVAVAAALLVALFDTRRRGQREVARNDDSLKEDAHEAAAGPHGNREPVAIQRSSEISDLAKDSTEGAAAMKRRATADRSAEVRVAGRRHRSGPVFDRSETARCGHGPPGAAGRRCTSARLGPSRTNRQCPQRRGAGPMRRGGEQRAR